MRQAVPQQESLLQPKPVGIVVGVTSTREFQMAVNDDSVGVQDLVAADDGVRRVWAKVAKIERLNPLFPKEAAQELAFSGRSAIDLPFSFSREMITATCNVIGEEKAGKLEPPGYPVSPACRVSVPINGEIEAILCGGLKDHHRLPLGHLRGDEAVKVDVNAHAVVSRHLGVLATTGAGKTVAVRKLLEGLIAKGYPLLIFDPHGDYLGLHISRKAEVTTYLPKLDLTCETSDTVAAYVAGLSHSEWSEAQGPVIEAIADALRYQDAREALNAAFSRHDLPPLAKSLEGDHFFALAELADRLGVAKGEGKMPRDIVKVRDGFDFFTAATTQAVARRCRQAGAKYAQMMKHGRLLAERNRDFLAQDSRISAEQLRMQELPSLDGLHEVVGRGKVAIVSLEGYSDELRQTLVARIMERLQKDRVADAVPRFLTVVEEAHNFVPNRADADGAPSLPVLKQIASEGRKYGMGLIFVSQRPSRLDSTILSQCNSFMILKVVNPYDQQYVRQVVESLGEEDSRLLPDLGTGEALLSGQFVRFPMVVKVKPGASEGRCEEEDFLLS